MKPNFSGKVGDGDNFDNNERAVDLGIPLPVYPISEYVLKSKPLEPKLRVKQPFFKPMKISIEKKEESPIDIFPKSFEVPKLPRVPSPINEVSNFPEETNESFIPESQDSTPKIPKELFQDPYILQENNMEKNEVKEVPDLVVENADIFIVPIDLADTTMEARNFPQCVSSMSTYKIRVIVDCQKVKFQLTNVEKCGVMTYLLKRDTRGENQYELTFQVSIFTKEKYVQNKESGTYLYISNERGVVKFTSGYFFVTIERGNPEKAFWRRLGFEGQGKDVPLFVKKMKGN